MWQHEKLFREWEAAGAQIPLAVMVEIQRLHEKLDWCSAHDEGQWCCLDYLDGSARKSVEDTIQEAKDFLAETEEK